MVPFCPGFRRIGTGDLMPLMSWPLRYSWPTKLVFLLKLAGASHLSLDLCRVARLRVVAELEPEQLAAPMEKSVGDQLEG